MIQDQNHYNQRRDMRRPQTGLESRRMEESIKTCLCQFLDKQVWRAVPYMEPWFWRAKDFFLPLWWFSSDWCEELCLGGSEDFIRSKSRNACLSALRESQEWHFIRRSNWEPEKKLIPWRRIVYQLKLAGQKQQRFQKRRCTGKKRWFLYSFAKPKRKARNLP